MNIFATSVVYFVKFLNGFEKMERWLRQTFWFGLVLAALGLGGARLDAATFTASLDRDTIALGESATLSLTFEGGSPKDVPTPNVSGLQIVNAGNSHNFSILNGQMSSTVEHFHARFDLPKLLKKFPQMKLASIGPETSKAIRTLGLEPALEAKEHTTDGLIAALLKAI